MFFDDVASAPTLRRAINDGRIRRLAPKIYTADLDSTPEEICHHEIWRILDHLLPGSVLVDRTAADDGTISHTLGNANYAVVVLATDQRTTDLDLPGVRVVVRPLERENDDQPWIGTLTLSSPARTVVDNLARSRSSAERPARTLSLPELQDWLARKQQAWGDRTNHVREEALRLAARRDGDLPTQVDLLFDQVTGAQPIRADGGQYARAVLAGDAWDDRRLELFAHAAATLQECDEADVHFPADPDLGEQPFYEAYFSNYIEGTEFTLPEAREIIQTRTPPARRPADGHDILGTYDCIVDPIGRAQTSEDPGAFIHLLRARHRTLLKGRPEMKPGEWKTENNRVGATSFVDWRQVEGTLRRGLERISDLPGGFARAVYAMFVIAEVHPFPDGNGRAARLMMNAELSTVGECRIVVPTIARNSYVSALRKASTADGDLRTLSRVLGHCWRWSYAIPWHDRAATEGQLNATNALLDSIDAENNRLHLIVP